ncbi:non-ribosomal peptide synthetase [Mucilaginibacter aquaedulcis]|uniref:non-ribosomal peptide synthetase n=1 Tax=Mucilaginibacter aquaedulcis TaxID=1187081 RepID=UPI0025B35289|nr:non-ribosomal peptide synthetase [Mucilaginibacter aquaedulcis]MDN3548275.1 amino acid adenylation domain-containing protein [Mucilaginibacter aquaedulcis]
MSRNLENLITPIDFNPFNGPEISLIAPVTEPQAEIWSSCVIGGNDANRAYNDSVSLLLTGDLNLNAMLDSLQQLVNLHDALRSTFSPDGKSICITEFLNANVNYQDISGQNTQGQQHYIDQYCESVALAPFDLIAGPLFKLSLFKLSDYKHYLTITAHHIICDGWSIGVLIQDLSFLYNRNIGKGNHSNIPGSLFSKYAATQFTTSKIIESNLAEQYWIKQFVGSDFLMNLPTGYVRPALRTYKSKREDFVLKGELEGPLRNLSKKTGCSFVTILFATFEVYMQQVTGQDEIIIGLPAAGQLVDDNYNLVGHCVNLLPLRSYPKGESSFVSYLKTRQTAMLDAYEHQMCTFGSLLKKLDLPRDSSRVPLVPVVLNIDSGMGTGVNFEDLDFKIVTSPREYETFEIFLNITDTIGAIKFEWSYNTQLFSSATIKKMMAEFEYLLSQVTSTPEILIGKIQFRNNEEIHRQIAAWNNTQSNYPKQRSLHEIISNKANEVADKTALKFGDEEISYAVMNKKSDQLAGLLIKKGLKKGDKVALAVNRSANMVIALLGIIKAGGVYVPVDPNYPLNRVTYMISDSQSVFLITSEQYKGYFQAESEELILEEILAGLETDSEPINLAKVNPTDLVYIIYTSGSTGLPKGVQIAHYNLVNFLYSMLEKPGLSADDKLLAVTTISFDIAGLELFLPLITGATVVIADAETAKDGRALLSLIKEQQITVMQATPFTWRMMIETGWRDKLNLKVICGGESLPLDLSKKIIERTTSLWNVYGPTETTVWSTLSQITGEEKNISIGRPIANTSIYIVDKYLRLCAPGKVGEICIGGDGVSAGYYNKPELTDEKFVTDPFSIDGKGKMYRTGDLGKFDYDGELQYEGRIDSQIKIRGFRIETAEIEHHITEFNGVKQSVVIARKDQSQSDQLVGYIVIEKNTDHFDESKWLDSLRYSLTLVLPDHMIPVEFAIVDDIPLTPNGKIDKKGLAKVSTKSALAPKAYIPPRTDIEKLVADIWSEFLGIEKISINDNFFKLGGHSLIAIQIMTKIEKATGKILPLAALFENSTIEKLALTLGMDGHSILWDSLVPIKPNGSKIPLYIVHGAGLHVLLFNALAINIDNEQPIYGLQAKGLNGIDTPLDKIEDIAAHYIANIMEQNPHGPYALAGYSFGGIIAFEMARQLRAVNKEVTMLAMFDTYAYQSDKYYPWFIKIPGRILLLLKQVIYITIQLFVKFKQTREHLSTLFKRSMTNLSWFFKSKDGAEQPGFYGYPNKIDQLNNKAWEDYKIKPLDIEIDLFRAEERTFYLGDFKYLGWKPYAEKGVNIHNIPGDHGSIFLPENAVKFASILQEVLNETGKK